MKLTPEQIQFIDNHFIENGITYWDIRMEMVDHIASDIEVSSIENFQKALKIALNKLKWNGNLQHIQNRRLKSINKKIRKQYFKEFFSIFKNVNTLAFSASAVLVYIYIYSTTNFTFFKGFSLAIFSIPPIIYLLNFLLMFLKKAYKSANTLYSSFYVFFAFLMLQMFVQWFKPDDVFEISQEAQKATLYIITVINTLFTYAGIKVHMRTLKNAQAIYNKLMF